MAIMPLSFDSLSCVEFCYNKLLLFSPPPQLAFYFDVMVSFYFPDEIKVSTVDITFVGEQSVF